MPVRASFSEPRSPRKKARKPFERPPKPGPRLRRPTNVKQGVIEKRALHNLTLEESHVAEMEYRPRKASKTYRLRVPRKRIEVTEGQLQLDDEIRYCVPVTPRPFSRDSLAAWSTAECAIQKGTARSSATIAPSSTSSWAPSTANS